VIARLLGRRDTTRATEVGQLSFWESRWSRPDFAAPWLGRSVSSEIVEAVDQGWFNRGAAALDIGCGEGDVVAWLAERGFPSLGVDIAPSAVARARHRFGLASGGPEFLAADVCRDPIPGGPFGVLVDRGCFHQIPDALTATYVRNISSIATDDARMLLFVRAFRGAGAGSPEAEREQVTEHVRQSLAPAFEIVRSGPTWLDRFGGARPDEALGGLCFWLERRLTT
jgi:SAM-dependent methyltransferase